MAARRDKYGRFRGNGGIKAYKSNLKPMKAGTKRQAPAKRGMKATPQKNGSGWSKKKKIAVGAAVVGTAVGVGIAADRTNQKLRQINSTDRASKARLQGARIQGTGVKPNFSNRSFAVDRVGTARVHAAANNIVQRNTIRRSATMTNVMAGAAARATARI